MITARARPSNRPRAADGTHPTDKHAFTESLPAHANQSVLDATLGANKHRNSRHSVTGRRANRLNHSSTQGASARRSPSHQSEDAPLEIIVWNENEVRTRLEGTQSCNESP